MTDKINLKPGTYQLQDDITNPHPDRRVKNDWRLAPEWLAGKIFIVEASEMITKLMKEQLIRDGVDVSKIPPEAYSRTTIRPADGGSSVNEMHESDEAFQLIAKSLKPCDESTAAMLTRLNIMKKYNDWDFFVYLCKKYGNSWFEERWNEYYEEAEDAL